MRHLVVKALLLVSVILVGCNTDDDSQDDMLLGTWELTENKETYLNLMDPNTHLPIINVFDEFDDTYTLTFYSDGSVIRYGETMYGARIDSGEVSVADSNYIIDFDDLFYTWDYRVDMIDASTIHAHYSDIDPICGGIHYRDVYTKVGN